MVSVMHLVMMGNHDVPHHWDGFLSVLSTWWNPTGTCPTFVAFKAIKAPPPQMLCYTDNQKELLGYVILSIAGHLTLLSPSFSVCGPQELSLSYSPGCLVDSRSAVMREPLTPQPPQGWRRHWCEEATHCVSLSVPPVFSLLVIWFQ